MKIMKLLKFLKKTFVIVSAVGLLATSVLAGTTLRVQTHFGETSPMGALYKQFAEQVGVMSGGDLKLEMFYSSSVVKPTETFDAAVNGVLDCDMTGSGYATGKNKAFQFTGDIIGAYDTPYQQLAWFYTGGGIEAAQELYNKYDMQLVGIFVPDHESLSSIRPLNSIDDLQGWRFRSPPGMITQIFEKLGAKPIVMDFSEIFTALETKLIDGADASQLAVNKSLGLYDIAKYTMYPGFHSMPSEHLACNKEVWDSLPASQQAIMESAAKELALNVVTTFKDANAAMKAQLQAEGITVSTWSDADIRKWRETALATWDEFGDTPEAKKLIAHHRAYLKSIGAID